MIDERPLPPWPPFGKPAANPPGPDAEPKGGEPTPAEPASAEPASAEPASAEPTVVYVHKKHGLLIFTAIMVALTVGVVLGQTTAYQQGSVYASPRAETTYSTPPTAPPPSPGTSLSAALGTTRDATFEVGGGAEVISVHSADLGARLYTVTTFDGSARPQMSGGTRPAHAAAADPSTYTLNLIHTGSTGRIGADVQLSSRVRWSLRLDGGTAEQDIDMTGGRLRGVDLAGGAGRVMLRLPAPTGTVAITLGGGANEFDVQAAAPIRIHLSKGAADSAVGQATRHTAKPGAVLTAGAWADARDRYDITASALLDLVRISEVPRVPPSAPPPPARSAPSTPSASTASTAARRGTGQG